MPDEPRSGKGVESVKGSKAGILDGLTSYGSEWLDVSSRMACVKSLIQASNKQELDQIVQTQNYLSPNQKETIASLYEIGELGTGEYGKDPIRLGKKMLAISDALAQSTAGPHIITYAGGGYTVVSVSRYRSASAGNPQNLNTNVIRGILKTATRTGDARIYDKYLSRETLKSLAIYLESREFHSRLIPEGVDVSLALKDLAEEKKTEIQRGIDTISKVIEQKLGDTTYRQKIRKISAESGIRFDAYGKVIVSSILSLASANIQTLDEPKAIKQLIASLDGICISLKARISDLKTEEQTILGNLGKANNIKSHFGSLTEKLEAIRPGLSLLPVASLSQSEAERILMIIAEGGAKDLNDDQIKVLLVLKIKTKRGAAQKELAATSQTKTSFVNGRIHPKLRDAVLDFSDIPEKESSKIKMAAEIGGVRGSLEDIRPYALALGIHTTDQARAMIGMIDLKRKPTETDHKNRAILIRYTEQEQNLKTAFHRSVKLLGKTEAQGVFADADRLISNNPSEIYRYDSTRGSIIQDAGNKGIVSRSIEIPESTGDIGKLRSTELYEKYPIFHRVNDTVMIKDTEGRIIQSGVRADQIAGLYQQIDVFDRLGLSTLLPFIGEINRTIGRTENFHIDSLDGNYSSEESSRVLQILAKVLFGEVFSRDQIEKAFAGEFTRRGVTNREVFIRNCLRQEEIMDDVGRVQISRLRESLSNTDLAKS